MSLIASGKNSLAKSSNTTFPMQNNTQTYTTSTQLSIMDELTFLAEDSHVNRLALQESERDQRMNATCGLRCLELSESVNPVGSWARTFAGLLVGRTDWYSKRVTLTWKILGTPSNRLLFQLVPQTLPTDATEFGLLLTPTTSEPVHDLEKFKARMEKYPNGTTMPNLATQVHGMLPTPTTKNVTGGAVQVNEKGKRQNKGGTEFSAQLHDLAKSGMLPTPTAQQERANASIDRGKGNLSDEVATRFQVGGKSSQLSPLFVEEMMGFPKNWTVSPFQSGEENQ